MKMSYPYPRRQGENITPLCMLPHKVDHLQDYDLCRHWVNECRAASLRKEYHTADPKYSAFAGYFDTFANGDVGKSEHVSKSDGSLTSSFMYTGGCALLRNDQLRDSTWPVAKEQLREQLSRYWTGQSTQWQPGTPNIRQKF